MGKKAKTFEKKKKVQERKRRLQTDLAERDGAKLDALIRAMGASSESEAVRRMIRFLHTVTALANGDLITLNVKGEKLIVPF